MEHKIDLLNRGEFVDNILKVINQLSKNRKGCCFAIEGSWGIGKSFVIEECTEQLKLLQLEQTNSDRYFVFHYNCWKYDYYEEPAIAIISSMISSIQEEESTLSVDATETVKAGINLAKEKLSEIAGLYLENKIGINLIDWVQKVDEKRKESRAERHEFDKLFNFGQTIETVRKKLKEIAKEKTLVLMVDELDRCIPQYAIKVLERLHHIFYGLDNVIVIMAIDRRQLEHTVEEMFGISKDENSDNVEKYLRKFIDFSMVLDNGVINEKFKEKYRFYIDKFQGTEEEKQKLFNMLVPLFDKIDIRRSEKIIDKASMVHTLICDKVADISLLGFEIMYEVLKFHNFSGWSTITLLNTEVGPYNKGIEEKIEFLAKLEDEAAGWGEPEYSWVRYVNDNLYGRIFWYFSEIFGEQENRYKYDSSTMAVIKDELEMAFKYCECREIIQ